MLTIPCVTMAFPEKISGSSLCRVFPRPFQMGVGIYISDPPSVSTHGGKPEISRKFSLARKRTENLRASFENPDPLWFFKCLFFLLNLFTDFFVNFPHFFMDISIFSWGVTSDRPDPPPFFRRGVRKSKWGVSSPEGKPWS